jgi:hypothetical protein
MRQVCKHWEYANEYALQTFAYLIPVQRYRCGLAIPDCYHVYIVVVDPHGWWSN